MKTFGRLRMGLAIAGVLLAGMLARAQAPGGGMGQGPGFGQHQPPMERAFGLNGVHGRWWNNPRIVERLKLTDEQRKTFDGILLQHREKLIDLRASLEKAELALEPLVREDQPNEAGILAQIDKVAQARAELEKANARFLLAIRARLTPEQWKSVQAFGNNREQDRSWGAGGRGTDGQGGNGNWRQDGPYNRPAPPLQPPPSSAEPAAPAALQPGAE